MFKFVLGLVQTAMGGFGTYLAIIDPPKGNEGIFLFICLANLFAGAVISYSAFSNLVKGDVK